MLGLFSFVTEKSELDGRQAVGRWERRGSERLDTRQDEIVRSLVRELEAAGPTGADPGFSLGRLLD